MAWLKKGDLACDFTLPDQNGNVVTLSAQWQKGPVVLYFYPRDETPGCIAQACTFRDSFEAYVEAGAQVIGVSRDTIAAHQAFAAHYRLPFTLLADVDGVAHKAWGVEKWLGLLTDRVTFVIDRHGIVQHTFSSRLRMGAHIQESLNVVKTLA